MLHFADSTLTALGLTLPEPTAPGANYVPFVRVDALLFLSGQLPLLHGRPAFVGKLGRGITIPQGQEAARICALNLLSQLRAALDGDFSRVIRCVRVGGYVNSTPEFTEQAQVVNGASDLFVALFGESGRHARTAIGVPSLHYDVPVEVDAIFEVR